MSSIDTNDTKPWWTSTTIQGAAVSILSALTPVISNVFHYELTEPAKLVAAVFTVVGFVMTIVGRGKASQGLH